jgi:hypothetical protein
MSDDQTYGGSSKVAATFHGADQDRVDRVDTAALRREYRSASRQDVLALCDEVDRLRSLIERTEDGWRRTNTECIKHWNRADAAEAEVDRLTETLNRVRAEVVRRMAYCPLSDGSNAELRGVLRVLDGHQP